MITLCIPVLNRYDTLEKCISSAESGTVKPDRYLIVDNGGKYNRLPNSKIDVYRPGFNIGVAKAWNYFIDNSSEIRIISNDDIEFFSNTIELMVEVAKSKNTIIGSSAINKVNIFSLFILPNSIVEKVGYFDESISPNYAYFEDNDYVYRMGLLGLYTELSTAMVGHLGSATLRAMTYNEEQKHHEKFRLAQANYIRKWGGLPTKETYLTPYNK